MAEDESNKRKFLYVLGREIPLKFLNGGRSLESVLSRNVKLRSQFQQKYGQQYLRVSDYYRPRKELVTLADVSIWVPELIEDNAETEETEL